MLYSKPELRSMASGPTGLCQDGEAADAGYGPPSVCESGSGVSYGPDNTCRNGMNAQGVSCCGNGNIPPGGGACDFGDTPKATPGGMPCSTGMVPITS